MTTTISPELQAAFDAFDEAEERGDEQAMRTALERARALTASTGVVARSGPAVAAVPSAVYLSTAVIGSDPPRNSADPHCDICRCSYPGSNDPRVALLPVRLGDRTITVCGPCRKRKNLVAA